MFNVLFRLSLIPGFWATLSVLEKIWRRFSYTEWTGWKKKYMTYSNLTGGNWQKWKRVFLTRPCHEIYRVEAVGLKSCKNTWKITIFVKMWNLGQYRENLISSLGRKNLLCVFGPWTCLRQNLLCNNHVFLQNACSEAKSKYEVFPAQRRYFVNNCLIKAWILKNLLHTCDTYNYDYLKYSTFRFYFIDFQLYIDFPFQFCVFYRKIT